METLEFRARSVGWGGGTEADLQVFAKGRMLPRTRVPPNMRSNIGQKWRRDSARATNCIGVTRGSDLGVSIGVIW